MLASHVQPATWARLGWCFVVTFATTTLVATLVLPKTISWDPSFGLLSAQQYVSGVSPDPLSTVQVDSGDLSRLVTVRNPLWSPSYQLVPLAFRMGSLN